MPKGKRLLEFLDQDVSCAYLLCLNLVCLLLMQIKALYQYDCLRANKSTSAWGVEARVPFLDKAFLDVAMGIDPEWKMVGCTSFYTSKECFFNI